MRRRALAAVLMVGVLTGASDPAELSDPTRPARSPKRLSAPTQKAEAELTLHSVMLSEHRRVAVINGRRVQLGDRAFGADVVEIGLSGVRLRREDGDFLLTLTAARVKKPSSRQRAAR